MEMIPTDILEQFSAVLKKRAVPVSGYADYPKKSIYRRGRRENILIFKQSKDLRVNTQKVNREISVLSCY